MAFTYTLDTATPASDSTDHPPSQGAERIRELKQALQERLNVDHYFPLTGTQMSDTETGEHRQVTLRVGAYAGAGEADKGILYAKDVSAKAELHYYNEDGVEVQITSGAALNASVDIPSGTKIWIYADTAPSGWTIDSTPSDELMAIKGGATYIAGGAQAGSWDNADGLGADSHVLSTAEIPAHAHTISRIVGEAAGGGGQSFTQPGATSTSTVGSGGGHVHTVSGDSSWRPLARVGIICSKD
jgi:hypothetical protein